MGEMTDRTVLVTGATSGIGRETALQLARMGARVLIHGRAEATSLRAVSDLSGGPIEGGLDAVWGDLGSLAQVRELARQVRSMTDRLHVLVNNAGVYSHDRVLTPDGNETTFAVNHLASYALTGLLKGLLIESAPARVVTVSSVAHFRGSIPFDDPTYEKRWDADAAYSDSKLANVLFAYEAAGRLAGSEVTSNTLHPGIIDTQLLRAGFPTRTGASPATGATGIVYLASSPEVEDVTGRYFVNLHPAQPSPLAIDHDVRERLWDLSEELTAVTFR